MLLKKIFLNVRFCLALLIILLLAKVFLFEVYTIPGPSMGPTLKQGDRVIVLKFFSGPARGDVVLFETPKTNKLLIKRVLGLGNEEMTFQNGQIAINDQTLEREPLTLSTSPQQDVNKASEFIEFLEFSSQLHLKGHRIFVNHEPDRSFFDQGRITVPPGSVFLLGDNRDLSEDSRNFGPVPLKKILGKAWLILSRAAAGPNEKTYLQKIDP